MVNRKIKIFFTIALILFFSALGLYSIKNPDFVRAASGGVITISARLAGLSAPVNDNDAATKAYVDAATGAGVKYMGTTAAYWSGSAGDLGGRIGANAKCNAVYAGSHICSARELVASGRTTALSTGWIDCETKATLGVDDTTQQWAGFCDGFGVSTGGQYYLYIGQCGYWNGWYGYWPVAYGALNPGEVYMQSCGYSTGIHCCK